MDIPEKTSGAHGKKSAGLPHCRRCRGHGEEVLLAGHKLCPYEHCPCDPCLKWREQTNKRYILDSLRKRARKRAESILDLVLPAEGSLATRTRPQTSTTGANFSNETGPRPRVDFPQTAADDAASGATPGATPTVSWSEREQAWLNQEQDWREWEQGGDVRPPSPLSPRNDTSGTPDDAKILPSDIVQIKMEDGGDLPEPEQVSINHSSSVSAAASTMAANPTSYHLSAPPARAAPPSPPAPLSRPPLPAFPGRVACSAVCCAPTACPASAACTACPPPTYSVASCSACPPPMYSVASADRAPPTYSVTSAACSAPTASASAACGPPTYSVASAACPPPTAFSASAACPPPTYSVASAACSAPTASSASPPHPSEIDSKDFSCPAPAHPSCSPSFSSAQELQDHVDTVHMQLPTLARLESLFYMMKLAVSPSNLLFDIEDQQQDEKPIIGLIS